jgi:hypothetical protein
VIFQRVGWPSPIEEASVAVAFIQEFEIVDGDTSTTNYDAIGEKLGRTAPPGLIVHSAGFDTDAGVFRIFDIWESSEAANRFLEEEVQPIVDEMRSASSDPSRFRPPDRQTVYELHNEIH